MTSSRGRSPAYLIAPRSAASPLEDCLRLCEAGGLAPLPWQRDVLGTWLALESHRPGARWASGTCGLSVPRQNGKTLGCLEARMIYGMLNRRERVIYTSHQQKTSTETFEELQAFFEEFEKTSKRKVVRSITTAYGRERIVLRNGARCRFVCRPKNGGRGLHGDLLVFDEAMELGVASQASFIPAISASRNPQTIYAGSPPQPENDGRIFYGIREKAISGGASRIAWAEWGVGEVGDVRDRVRWRDANPSFGTLIDEKTVESECDQMDPLSFAIERLGYWMPMEDAVESAIPAGLWKRGGLDETTRGGSVSYGVKFSPDGSHAALAACATQADGSQHVELVKVENMGEGVGWLAEWLGKRSKKAVCAVIDGGAYASVLATRLRGMGVPKGYVVTPGARDVAAAASGLLDGLASGRITHLATSGQRALDESARCPRRPIGKDGSWGFGSTESLDSCPIEAASLASWGGGRAKPRKERKVILA